VSAWPTSDHPHSDAAAEELLAREATIPSTAPALKRTIQRLIQDPLALKILSGEFSEGDAVVAMPGRRIVFRKQVDAKPRERRSSSRTSPRRIPRRGFVTLAR